MARTKTAPSGNQPLGGRVMTLEEAAREAQTFPMAANPVTDPGALNEEEDYAPSPIDLAERTIAEIGQGEHGAPGKVQVWRHRDGKRETFMYECEVQDWQSQGFAYIRDTYGSGTYRVRVYAGGHMRVNRLIDVEAPSVEPARATPAPAQDDVLRAIGSMMAESMRQMGQMVSQALQHRQDESQQFTRTLDMVRAMREAFGPTQQIDPMTQLRPMVEMMRSLKELQGEVSEPSSGSWIEKMAERVLPDILAQPSPPVDSQALPAPVQPATAPAPMPAPAQPSEEEMYKMFLKRALADLVQHAARSAEIDPIAQEIADKVPDQFIAQLCDNPKWFDELAAIEPEIRNFRPWFDRLRAKVDELTTEPDAGIPGNHAA